MKKPILFIALCLIALPVHAQQAILNDISIKQGDLNVQNGIITNAQAAITTADDAITAAQAQIAIDNAAIASDTAINNAYIDSTAQNITGINWNYFDALEIAGDRYASFSAVASGINWPAITTQLNITCAVSGGEAGVNWNNWSNCEANGVSGGVSIGTYNSGWSAFYCGAGHVSGKC
jgi:hypothetical protein